MFKMEKKFCENLCSIVLHWPITELNEEKDPPNTEQMGGGGVWVAATRMFQ